MAFRSAPVRHSAVPFLSLDGLQLCTALATPPGLTGCYGITTSYLFSIWIPGLVFEMWLVLLAIYKAIERARSGIVVNGHRLDLLALLIRDKYVPPILLHGCFPADSEGSVFIDYSVIYFVV